MCKGSLVTSGQWLLYLTAEPRNPHLRRPVGITSLPYKKTPRMKFKVSFNIANQCHGEFGKN
jgi:hypothetical protein